MKINSKNLVSGIVLLGDYYKDTTDLSKKIWGDWLNYFGIAYHAVKMLENDPGIVTDVAEMEIFERVLLILKDLNHLFYQIYETERETQGFPPEVPLRIECLEMSLKSNFETVWELVNEAMPSLRDLSLMDKMDSSEKLVLTTLSDDLSKLLQEVLQIIEQRKEA